MQLYTAFPVRGRSLAEAYTSYRDPGAMDRQRTAGRGGTDRERWSHSVEKCRKSAGLGLSSTTLVPYNTGTLGRAATEWRSGPGVIETGPLEKEPLRENPLAFVADDCSERRMFREHTSGTTGKALVLLWSHATVRAWYGLFEARFRRWYGVSRHDRWAILGGQLVSPAGRHRPPFWVWNAALNQLYMSSYHLAPDFILLILMPCGNIESSIMDDTSSLMRWHRSFATGAALT